MKTLVIVGHPDLSQSRVNSEFISILPNDDSVTVKKLAEIYPDYVFDIEKEQKDIVDHDRVVLLFPMFWYSSPAILKKWIDDVFLPGFAYARGGDKLAGKEFLVAVTIGAPKEGYRSGGFNNYTVDEMLRPFQQTANYVKARYITPFLFYQSVFASESEILEAAKEFKSYILGDQESPDVIYEKLILQAEQAQIDLIS